MTKMNFKMYFLEVIFLYQIENRKQIFYKKN